MENYNFMTLSESGEITEEVERAKKIARDRYYDRLYNADEDIYVIELKDFIYKYYGEGEGEDFRVEWWFDEDLERYVMEGIDYESIGEYLINMTYEDKDINGICQDIIERFPQIDDYRERFHFHNSIMRHLYDKYIDICAGGDTFHEDDMMELLFELDKKYGLNFREFPHETLRDLLKLYGDLPLKYLNRSFELYRRINIGIMEDMKYTNGNIIYALKSYGPARFNLDHLKKAQKDIDWFREQIKNYLEKNNKEASQLILENIEKFNYEEERLALAMENLIEIEKIILPYEDKAKKIMMEVFE